MTETNKKIHVPDEGWLMARRSVKYSDVRIMRYLFCDSYQTFHSPNSLHTARDWFLAKVAPADYIFCIHAANYRNYDIKKLRKLSMRLTL